MPTSNTASEDTRAIARQAVEDDFRQKKKRGYDSSDDEGNKKSNRKTKQSKHETTCATKKKPTTTRRPVAIWEVKYRDRAKERREGKPVVDPMENDAMKRQTATDNRAQSLLEDVWEEDEGGGRRRRKLTQVTQ